MKAYAYEPQKYYGSLTDNFERKLKLLMERSEQCGVAPEEIPEAFSLILTGVALEYYFTHVKGVQPGFDDMIAKLQKRFLTEDRTLTLKQEC